MSSAIAGEEDGSEHFSQVSTSVSFSLSGESPDASLDAEKSYLPGLM